MQSAGCRIEALEFRCKVEKLGFRVQGAGCRVLGSSSCALLRDGQVSGYGGIESSLKVLKGPRPHSGLPCENMFKPKPVSVTLSVGNSPMSLRVAYRRVISLIACRVPSQSAV